MLEVRNCLLVVDSPRLRATVRVVVSLSFMVPGLPALKSGQEARSQIKNMAGLC